MMMENPNLIRRPILVRGSKVTFGFDKDEYTGQDGSYLAELLLDKGYEVYGMTRRASTENVERIGHLTDRLTQEAVDFIKD